MSKQLRAMPAARLDQLFAYGTSWAAHARSLWITPIGGRITRTGQLEDFWTTERLRLRKRLAPPRRFPSRTNSRARALPPLRTVRLSDGFKDAWNGGRVLSETAPSFATPGGQI